MCPAAVVGAFDPGHAPPGAGLDEWPRFAGSGRSSAVEPRRIPWRRCPRLRGYLQDPAGHRDRDPAGSEVTHEWVEPFGLPPNFRFAWERYAAALRSTSFSCSRRRLRRRSSRTSAASSRVVPGFLLASTSACLSQPLREASLMPKSAAISFKVTSSPRARATATTSSRNSCGYGAGMVLILSHGPVGPKDWLSPSPAPVPCASSRPLENGMTSSR